MELNIAKIKENLNDQVWVANNSDIGKFYGPEIIEETEDKIKIIFSLNSWDFAIVSATRQNNQWIIKTLKDPMSIIPSDWIK
jgi:hypothetical protein